MYILYGADIKNYSTAYNINVTKGEQTMQYLSVPDWQYLNETCNGSKLVYIYYTVNGTRSVTTGYYSKYAVTPEYKKVLYGGSYIGAEITETFNILTQFDENLLVCESYDMILDDKLFKCRIVSQSTTYSKGVPNKMVLTSEIIY